MRRSRKNEGEAVQFLFSGLIKTILIGVIIAILENGKKVQISYVINKGKYGKRAAKAKKEYYLMFYGQYIGKPLSEWITYDQLMRGNNYEHYLKGGI